MDNTKSENGFTVEVLLIDPTDEVFSHILESNLVTFNRISRSIFKNPKNAIIKNDLNRSEFPFIQWENYYIAPYAYKRVIKDFNSECISFFWKVTVDISTSRDRENSEEFENVFLITPPNSFKVVLNAVFSDYTSICTNKFLSEKR